MQRGCRDISESATFLGNRPVDLLALQLVEELLDDASHVTFALKDRALRYIGANRAMVELCGARTRAEVIGKTARDFFVEQGGLRYEAADRLVMRTRRPLKGHLDLTVRARGAPVWVILGRWPVIDRDETIAGVAVTARQ